MDNNSHTPFIFYLTLEENLPKTFYVFDRLFKARGFILVPVRVDQLQSLLASTDQTQMIVIISVIDSRELRVFNEKTRGLLKYVLKSKRLTFMQLSSFSKINDTRQFAFNKNYFFLKYPMNASLLADKIVRYYMLKSETNLRWPGGKKAGLGAVA